MCAFWAKKSITPVACYFGTLTTGLVIYNFLLHSYIQGVAHFWTFRPHWNVYEIQFTSWWFHFGEKTKVLVPCKWAFNSLESIYYNSLKVIKQTLRGSYSSFILTVVQNHFANKSHSMILLYRWQKLLLGDWSRWNGHTLFQYQKAQDFSTEAFLIRVTMSVTEHLQKGAFIDQCRNPVCRPDNFEWLPYILEHVFEFLFWAYDNIIYTASWFLCLPATKTAIFLSNMFLESLHSQNII